MKGMFIGLIIMTIGWLLVTYFAAKQMRLQKEYERLPQKWQEIKRTLFIKRFISRALIILGILIAILSLWL